MPMILELLMQFLQHEFSKLCFHLRLYPSNLNHTPLPSMLSCLLFTFYWSYYGLCLDFFFTFSDNLFKLSHSLILLSSLVISVSTVSLGFMDLIDCSEADRFVSSAYIML